MEEKLPPPYVPVLPKITLSAQIQKMLPAVKMMEPPKKDPLREYLRRFKSARS